MRRGKVGSVRPLASLQRAVLVTRGIVAAHWTAGSPAAHPAVIGFRLLHPHKGRHFQCFLELAC
jgi:hypothetical protein